MGDVQIYVGKCRSEAPLENVNRRSVKLYAKGYSLKKHNNKEFYNKTNKRSVNTSP
jgi:hypothetical protein